MIQLKHLIFRLEKSHKSAVKLERSLGEHQHMCPSLSTWGQVHGIPWGTDAIRSQTGDPQAVHRLLILKLFKETEQKS